MTEPYEPIACSFHDVLEDAAVLKRECRIVVRDADGEALNEITTTIADVYAREGAEYALLGTGLEVRLDRLVEVEPLDSGVRGRWEEADG